MIRQSLLLPSATTLMLFCLLPNDIWIEVADEACCLDVLSLSMVSRPKRQAPTITLRGATDLHAAPPRVITTAGVGKTTEVGLHQIRYPAGNVSPQGYDASGGQARCV